MNILPVRRMRVPEEIVDQVRGLIASGDLRPGDQLPSERELAERFQVSRASIREALTALQVLGLLERSRTGGGLAARGNHVWFTIAPLSSYLATRSHIIEQIEVRRMIEPEMGRLAASRATPADLDRMAQCLADMEADLEAGGRGSEADAAFHAAIAATTANELLTRIVQLIGDAIREHRELFQTPEGARASLEEHREMLDAIRRGDGEAAYEHTRRHIDTVRRLLEDAISDRSAGEAAARGEPLRGEYRSAESTAPRGRPLRGEYRSAGEAAARGVPLRGGTAARREPLRE